MGSLSRWSCLGVGQPVEGLARPWERADSSLLPSSLSFSLPPAAREAGVRGSWIAAFGQRRRSDLPSSLLLFGLHCYRPNDSGFDLYPGGRLGA